MTKVEMLLAELTARQIQLAVEGDELKIKAPKGALTPELRSTIVALKNELLAQLSGDRASSIDLSLFFFASDDTVNPAGKYDLLIEGAKFADAHGFSGIWMPERHFHRLGGLFPNPAITAAALSTITRNLRLRAGSVVMPLHDPLRVAEEWAMIDNLSGGRVELSFASGWHVNDFVFAPEAYPRRKAIMYEGIDTVRRLWAGGSIQRKSGAGSAIEVAIRPEPLQKDLSVWITAIGSPDSYQQVGRAGAHLLTSLLDQEVEELAEKIPLYRKAREQAGFDPATGKVAVFMHTFLGPDLDEVRETVRRPFTDYLASTLDLLSNLVRSAGLDLDPKELAEDERAALLDFAFERYFERRTLLGTEATARAMLAKLAAAGVNEAACLVDFGLDQATVMAGLHWLAKARQS